jgi:putative glutamine amidotransferase
VRVALTLDRDSEAADTNDYVRALAAAGLPRPAIEIVTPQSAHSAAAGAFDALVLGGGGDVDPARYGRRARADARLEVDLERDSLDFALLGRALGAGTPVLGICRGLQVVNVALGGTLVQDLATERPSSVSHQEGGSDRTRRAHPVIVAPGSRLAEIAVRDQVSVNSRHHQAIERIAPGLAVSATAPDGLVEGVELPDGAWLLGVQWHPENLEGDPVAERIFAAFLRVARERAAPVLRP